MPQLQAHAMLCAVLSQMLCAVMCRCAGWAAGCGQGLVQCRLHFPSRLQEQAAVQVRLREPASLRHQWCIAALRHAHSKQHGYVKTLSVQ
jgi:hypothetical protein